MELPFGQNLIYSSPNFILNYRLNGSRENVCLPISIRISHLDSEQYFDHLDLIANNWFNVNLKTQMVTYFAFFPPRDMFMLRNLLVFQQIKAL